MFWVKSRDRAQQVVDNSYHSVSPLPNLPVQHEGWPKGFAIFTLMNTLRFLGESDNEKI